MCLEFQHNINDKNKCFIKEYKSLHKIVATDSIQTMNIYIEDKSQIRPRDLFSYSVTIFTHMPSTLTRWDM